MKKDGTIGESVKVHAFGSWYAGTITKVYPSGKVDVEFTTGPGRERTKRVQYLHTLPADLESVFGRMNQSKARALALQYRGGVGFFPTKPEVQS